MKKISNETVTKFLECLGRTNLGDGYIDAIVYALLKIIEQTKKELV